MEHADCGQCANKVDVGEEWLCCSDCSEPQITDTDARVGFCQTRASLGSQLKPRGQLLSQCWQQVCDLVLWLLILPVWFNWGAALELEWRWVELRWWRWIHMPSMHYCPGTFSEVAISCWPKSWVKEILNLNHHLLLKPSLGVPRDGTSAPALLATFPCRNQIVLCVKDFQDWDLLTYLFDMNRIFVTGNGTWKSWAHILQSTMDDMVICWMWELDLQLLDQYNTCILIFQLWISQYLVAFFHIVCSS